MITGVIYVLSGMQYYNLEQDNYAYTLASIKAQYQDVFISGYNYKSNSISGLFISDILTNSKFDDPFIIVNNNINISDLNIKYNKHFTNNTFHEIQRKLTYIPFNTNEVISTETEFNNIDNVYINNNLKSIPEYYNELNNTYNDLLLKFNEDINNKEISQPELTYEELFKKALNKDNTVNTANISWNIISSELTELNIKYNNAKFNTDESLISGQFNATDLSEGRNNLW